ncbi:hypothetical protein SLA2020_350830 [Shorea laevis]
MLTRADLQEILEEFKQHSARNLKKCLLSITETEIIQFNVAITATSFVLSKISTHDVQPEQTRTESEGAAIEQSKKAEEVKVDQTEKFQKLRAECDLPKPKIKNDDVLVQELVKEKSDDDWPYYDAEQLFDEKLKSVPAQKEFQISVPVLVVKKLELRRNMKYLVGLRHRWRWKYDAEQMFDKKLHRELGTSVLPLPKLPQVDLHGIVQPEPLEVLNRRSRKSNSCFVIDLLILWAGQMADDATRYGTLEKASTFLHESPGEVRSENQSPKVMRLAWGNSSHVCCL